MTHDIAQAKYLIIKLSDVVYLYLWYNCKVRVVLLEGTFG